MIEVVGQGNAAKKVPFAVVNGMMFFNCTQETIDREVAKAKDVNSSYRPKRLLIEDWP